MMEYLLLREFHSFLIEFFVLKIYVNFYGISIIGIKNCIIPLKKFVAKQSNKSGYERFQNSK